MKTKPSPTKDEIAWKALVRAHIAHNGALDALKAAKVAYSAAEAAYNAAKTNKK